MVFGFVFVGLWDSEEVAGCVLHMEELDLVKGNVAIVVQFGYQRTRNYDQGLVEAITLGR